MNRTPNDLPVHPPRSTMGAGTRPQHSSGTGSHLRASVQAACLTAALVLPVALSGATPVAESKERGASPPFARIAQAASGSKTTSRTTDPVADAVDRVRAAPGATIQLPLRLPQIDGSSRQFVVLEQVPDWMRLPGADSMGSGVLLIGTTPSGRLDAVLAPAASPGTYPILLRLLGADGQPLSDGMVTVEVVQSPPHAQSPTAAEAARAQAGPQPPSPTTPPVAPARGPSWTSFVGGKQPSPAAIPPPAVAVQPARAPVIDPKDEAKLIEYAKVLVRECTTCHSLFGTDEGIPPMIGMARDRFIDTMKLYKSGRRDHGPMRSVVESLDDQELLALALYLGRIRPPTPEELARSASPARAATASPATLAKRGTPENQTRVERWIARAEGLIAVGDLAQARLLLERAAEHGSAQAAYLIGTTYDPNTLPWRPELGLVAEPARARDWYGIAQSLGGGPEVARRLSELTGR